MVSNSATPRLFEKADYFAGPKVPASAISYRLNVVRKEGAALGLTSGPGSFSPAAKTNGITAKRAVSAVKKKDSKGKGRNCGKNISVETTGYDDIWEVSWVEY